MGAVKNALITTRSMTDNAASTALYVKARGNQRSLEDLLKPADGFSTLTQFQQTGANRQRYALFRGWVHAAINALASEAGSQPVQVGKMKSKGKPGSTKSHILKKLPTGLRQKAANQELEVLPDHEMLTSLERPNPLQHRWQFVYSYVANLCLTGWSFIVCGENDDGVMEYYSIPTTWVVPDHTEGLFARFRIVNPNNPERVTYEEDEWFTREQIGFSYFPDPSDPMRALSLTQAQQMGIRIDDHIQTSQSAFFENGVFPSVIVTMGTNPHPDVPAGIRPRLNAVQRRQVYAAIKKVSGGVANYGNPAIVDGLIEKIERLSATQTEMGWEKSEQAVRTRILSSFCVHPYILGETMPGSYAQAYIIEQRFCKRVNLYLEMLGWLMTDLNRMQDDADESLLVWWTPTKPHDPQMELQLWQGARQRGDVTQNEFRSEMMDLPPEVEANEAFINQTELPQILQIASQTTMGNITTDQAQAILTALGIPDKIAKQIAGDGAPEGAPPPGTPPGGFTTDADGYPLPADNEEDDSEDNEDAVEKAIRVLDRAVKYLDESPTIVADGLLESV